jgi:hypothetical protein
MVEGVKQDYTWLDLSPAYWQPAKRLLKIPFLGNESSRSHPFRWEPFNPGDGCQM